jgi:hypothetical protein
MRKLTKIERSFKSLFCLVFSVLFSLVSLKPCSAGPFKELLNNYDSATDATELSNDEILKSSQISYRAEGGFTGVQSYGVILRCVNGKVSVMKSIYDPHLSGDKGQIRDIGSMNFDDYLALWNNLDRHAVFKMADAPLPKMDILDEFTIQFNAKVGNTFHHFQVYGISRPEAARYFALRKLVDDAVGMQELWNNHSELVRNLGSSSPTVRTHKSE